MDAKQKLAAVDRYVEAFEKGDLDIIRSLYADNAVVEDPVGTDPHHGLEAICKFYEGALGAGIKLTLSGTPRCAGNAVAFPFRVNGPSMSIEVIDVFEFNDEGKVVKMKAYWGPENVEQG
ncbi:nuclear transport factor 2 family protein [Parahaliea sp. F7430]|uniref:Nuclear transport factor 2 family protein n=1 Tax=Sediminihaliea albiluteola TaxID=2758564 RepID=A0A7W2TVW6_9GAMM|nr:nuclear transport factor 2 family protein [Sediminihaliea albiluteola]MBA6412900.1 nuclear transport factor 2 family protein [Sediminihaliea albiluteola]